jgi:hypothetical protein
MKGCQVHQLRPRPPSQVSKCEDKLFSKQAKRVSVEGQKWVAAVQQPEGVDSLSQGMLRLLYSFAKEPVGGLKPFGRTTVLRTSSFAKILVVDFNLAPAYAF